MHAYIVYMGTYIPPHTCMHTGTCMPASKLVIEKIDKFVPQIFAPLFCPRWRSEPWGDVGERNRKSLHPSAVYVLAKYLKDIYFHDGLSTFV